MPIGILHSPFRELLVVARVDRAGPGQNIRRVLSAHSARRIDGRSQRHRTEAARTLSKRVLVASFTELPGASIAEVPITSTGNFSLKLELAIRIETYVSHRAPLGDSRAIMTISSQRLATKRSRVQRLKRIELICAL